MNNTKANGLQNAHFLIISVPGLICAIQIPYFIVVSSLFCGNTYFHSLFIKVLIFFSEQLVYLSLNYKVYENLIY